MNLYEGIKNNLNTSTKNEIDSWWSKNYERAINYVDNENPEIIVDEFFNGDWDTYNCESGKHVALTILYRLGPDAFEKRLDSFENNLGISESERSLSPPEVDETEVTGRIHVTYVFNTTVPSSWNHDDVENELKSNLSEYTDEIETIDCDFSYEGPEDYEDRMVDEHIYDERMGD